MVDESFLLVVHAPRAPTCWARSTARTSTSPCPDAPWASGWDARSWTPPTTGRLDRASGHRHPGSTVRLRGGRPCSARDAAGRNRHRRQTGTAGRVERVQAASGLPSSSGGRLRSSAPGRVRRNATRFISARPTPDRSCGRTRTVYPKGPAPVAGDGPVEAPAARLDRHRPRASVVTVRVGAARSSASPPARAANCTVDVAGVERRPSDDERRAAERVAHCGVVAHAGGLDVVHPHAAHSRRTRASKVPTRRAPWPACPDQSRFADLRRRHVQLVDVVGDHAAGEHLAGRARRRVCRTISIQRDRAGPRRRGRRTAARPSSRSGRRARRPPGRRGGPGRRCRRRSGWPSRSRRRTTRPTSRRSTDRLRPPLSAAFMPEVPQASSGRSGLFSQTSQPGNMSAAMPMS